jgi:uncharacterized membrane protein YqiK
MTLEQARDFLDPTKSGRKQGRPTKEVSLQIAEARLITLQAKKIEDETKNAVRAVEKAQKAQAKAEKKAADAKVKAEKLAAEAEASKVQPVTQPVTSEVTPVISTPEPVTDVLENLPAPQPEASIQPTSGQSDW